MVFRANGLNSPLISKMENSLKKKEVLQLEEIILFGTCDSEQFRITGALQPISLLPYFKNVISNSFQFRSNSDLQLNARNVYKCVTIKILIRAEIRPFSGLTFFSRQKKLKSRRPKMFYQKKYKIPKQIVFLTSM